MENKKVKGFLVSVNPTIKANSNGTQYRTCTVRMSDGNNYIAKIWEKSYQYGVELGSEYTIEGQVDGDTIWLTVLNGPSANIASVANLGAMFGVAENTLAEEPLF